MKSPPPMAAALAQAQGREDSPEAAIADYAALQARCQSGAATELSKPKDDCGTVAFRLAQSLERAQRYPEAAQAFAAVRSYSSDRVRIGRSLVRLATLQADFLNQPEEALRTCRQLLSEFPADVPAEDALRLLVRVQTERGAKELASELDRLAATLRPYETVASFALLYGAQLAERSERAADAVARYDEIWKRYPRGPLFDDALVAAARLLRKLGRSAEAAERLERLAQSYVQAAIVGHYNQMLLIESMLLLGEIYVRDLHRPQPAMATLSRLIERSPSSRLCDDALLLMAEAALQQRGDEKAAGHSQACGYLARLLRDYPDSNQRRAAQKLQREQQCAEAARP